MHTSLTITTPPDRIAPPAKTTSLSDAKYKCHTCDFTTNRLNVIVLHSKTHSTRPTPPARVLPVIAPLLVSKIFEPIAHGDRQCNQLLIDSDDDTITTTTTTESNPKTPEKRQTDDTSIMPPKSPEKKAKIDVKTSLLADWDDSDDETAIAPIADTVNTTNVDVVEAIPLSPTTISAASSSTVVTTTSTTTTAPAALSSPPIPSTSRAAAANHKDTATLKYRNIPKKDRRNIIFENFSITDASTSSSSANEDVGGPIILLDSEDDTIGSPTKNRKSSKTDDIDNNKIIIAAMDAVTIENKNHTETNCVNASKTEEMTPDVTKTIETPSTNAIESSANNDAVITKATDNEIPINPPSINEENPPKSNEEISRRSKKFKKDTKEMQQRKKKQKELDSQKNALNALAITDPMPQQETIVSDDVTSIELKPVIITDITEDAAENSCSAEQNVAAVANDDLNLSVEEIKIEPSELSNVNGNASAAITINDDDSLDERIGEIVNDNNLAGTNIIFKEETLEEQLTRPISVIDATESSSLSTDYVNASADNIKVETCEDIEAYVNSTYESNDNNTELNVEGETVPIVAFTPPPLNSTQLEPTVAEDVVNDKQGDDEEPANQAKTDSAKPSSSDANPDDNDTAHKSTAELSSTNDSLNGGALSISSGGSTTSTPDKSSESLSRNAEAIFAFTEDEVEELPKTLSRRKRRCLPPGKVFELDTIDNIEAQRRQDEEKEEAERLSILEKQKEADDQKLTANIDNLLSSIVAPAVPDMPITNFPERRAEKYPEKLMATSQKDDDDPRPDSGGGGGGGGNSNSNSNNPSLPPKERNKRIFKSRNRSESSMTTATATATTATSSSSDSCQLSSDDVALRSPTQQQLSPTDLNKKRIRKIKPLNETASTATSESVADCIASTNQSDLMIAHALLNLPLQSLSADNLPTQIMDEMEVEENADRNSWTKSNNADVVGKKDSDEHVIAADDSTSDKMPSLVCKIPIVCSDFSQITASEENDMLATTPTTVQEIDPSEMELSTPPQSIESNQIKKIRMQRKRKSESSSEDRSTSSLSKRSHMTTTTTATTADELTSPTIYDDDNTNKPITIEGQFIIDDANASKQMQLILSSTNDNEDSPAYLIGRQLINATSHTATNSIIDTAKMLSSPTAADFSMPIDATTIISNQITLLQQQQQKELQQQMSSRRVPKMIINKSNLTIVGQVPHQPDIIPHVVSDDHNHVDKNNVQPTLPPVQETKQQIAAAKRRKTTPTRKKSDLYHQKQIGTDGQGKPVYARVRNVQPVQKPPPTNSFISKWAQKVPVTGGSNSAITTTTTTCGRIDVNNQLSQKPNQSSTHSSHQPLQTITASSSAAAAATATHMLMLKRTLSQSEAIASTSALPSSISRTTAPVKSTTTTIIPTRSPKKSDSRELIRLTQEEYMEMERLGYIEDRGNGKVLTSNGYREYNKNKRLAAVAKNSPLSTTAQKSKQINRSQTAAATAAAAAAAMTQHKHDIEQASFSRNISGFSISSSESSSSSSSPSHHGGDESTTTKPLSTPSRVAGAETSDNISSDDETVNATQPAEEPKAIEAEQLVINGIQLPNDETLFAVLGDMFGETSHPKAYYLCRLNEFGMVERVIEQPLFSMDDQEHNENEQLTLTLPNGNLLQGCEVLQSPEKVSFVLN